ncbi:MAG: formate--phosphoribosylaminoimidazolecarboxamide ligase [Candidatus Altiarchaeota archaeon]
MSDVIREVRAIAGDYDEDNLTIATIGSHSALNIFKGARDEGFKTVCVAVKGRERVYKYFNLVDEFIYVDDMSQLLDDEVQEKLRGLNSIVVPHGSFNAYIDQDRMEKEFKVPLLGNRGLNKWETSRIMQHEWLRKAGLKVPQIYKSIDELREGLAFVKFPGAKGGKGYFVVDSPDAFEKKLKTMVKNKLVTEEEAEHPYIQEYIIGVTIYPHYFYSALSDETEFLGLDKRYESSVDGIFRIPVPEQLAQEISPTFSIVGNFPMVVRESLLNDIFDIGEKIVDESQKIQPPGVLGPFCLETICTEDMQLVAFEISTRIVAGCNVNIPTNPYAYLKYGENMYMGRRIAREVKEAVNAGRIREVVT